MDGAGRQHYLAGHGRLKALVHQLDADKHPRDRCATESARLLGVLDERLAGRDWVMGADDSIADIRFSAGSQPHRLLRSARARRLRSLSSRAGMARLRSRGAGPAASDGGLGKVCSWLN
jgi:GSH-dependent disulfide-bond oxidoreductase